jgi:hypothetical protein
MSTNYQVNYAGTRPVSVKASTLTAAKRAASRHCIFQGQTVRVFLAGQCVAVRRACPINMSHTGRWERVTA